MTYRTTCPECASIFRLGADQLDAAAGWVQCGVCGAAFDAHPALLLEDGSPLPVPEAEPDRVDVPAEAAAPERDPGFANETPSPGGEASPVGADGNIAAAHETPPSDTFEPPAAQAPDDTPDPEPAATPQGIVQREAAPELPSIILIDPDAEPADDDPGPLPHISAPAYPPRTETSAYPPPPAYPADAPAARIEYASDRAQPIAASAYAPAPKRRMPLWLGLLASGVLVVVLVVQLAYFLRDPLASRYPETRPLLAGACEVVGCTLSLPKNPALLRIVGSDLQTEASGRLKLTLTLGNRAGHAQAWPVLVLTLMDQRNRPLARRSFAPSEYLSDAKRIAAGIPPRSEQGLSLPLNVRDITPLGYDLRLTY